MNIKQAYNSLTLKDFVNWALKNNYDYFLICDGGTKEHGWIWSKGKFPKQYKFNY